MLISELPKENTAPRSLSPKSLLLYGAPKVGKTSMLAQLAGNLILDTDAYGGGTAYHNCRAVVCENVAEYNKALFLCKATPQPYVSLDVVDTIEEWAEEMATKYYKSIPQGKNFDGDSVLELDMGGGYRYLREKFTELIKPLLKLSMSGKTRVILTAHMRLKISVDDNTGDKSYKDLANKGKLISSGNLVGVKDLDLTGKICSLLCGAVDTIGYVFRNKEDQLMISFKTSDDIRCGSRCPHLAGQVIPFEWNRIYID